MSNTADLLNVIIRKRTGTEFSGPARSFSSINDRGSFDILPRHAGFVCLLRDRIEIDTADKGWLKIAIGRAVMRVKQNQVDVFLGI